MGGGQRAGCKVVLKLKERERARKDERMRDRKRE